MASFQGGTCIECLFEVAGYISGDQIRGSSLYPLKLKLCILDDRIEDIRLYWKLSGVRPILKCKDQYLCSYILFFGAQWILLLRVNLDYVL